MKTRIESKTTALEFIDSVISLCADARRALAAGEGKEAWDCLEMAETDISAVLDWMAREADREAADR